MLSGVFTVPSIDVHECDRRPSGVPIGVEARDRLRVVCVNAPTLSGVRSANLPKPPRRMPRPSGSTLTATPTRGE